MLILENTFQNVHGSERKSNITRDVVKALGKIQHKFNNNKATPLSPALNKNLQEDVTTQPLECL